MPDPVLRDDLRVLPADEVLLACARDLGVLDLVVLLDSAIRSGDARLPSLARLACSRRPGSARLGRALRWADPRSESAWESVLRVLHVVCDVRVEAQREVYDDGRFLARGDLWLVGTRVLHEYDGGTHLRREAQNVDLRRSRRLGNSDWLRRGYTSDDVIRRAVTILRDADLSLGRPHRPERVRAWHALLAGSLFTPMGTARLRRRWAMDDDPTGHRGTRTG
jgi:very-short-patch-repair endonuclease